MTRNLEDFYFERPQFSQRVHVGQRLLPNAEPRLYTGKPRIGLVITTYGAAPYVELGLAMHQRMYRGIPVLVHDDASNERDALATLCDKYGATFECNSSALGHEMGDLSGIVGGLHWARSLGLDLLVKMSRRCVPLSDWIGGLQALAETTQYATFGRRCQDYNLMIRTECFAMGVKPWCDSSVLEGMTAFMLKNRASLLVENYVFEFVRRVYEINCEGARAWERANVLITPRPTYIEWPFLSEGRRRPSPNYLLHETEAPAAFMRVAELLGLSFAPGAFDGICSQATK